ncbi:MAG: hypothetical protein RL329_893, partial [Bacteroidota bacterium]
ILWVMDRVATSTTLYTFIDCAFAVETCAIRLDIHALFGPVEVHIRLRKVPIWQIWWLVQQDNTDFGYSKGERA